MYQEQEEEGEYDQPRIANLLPELIPFQRTVIVEQEADKRRSQYQHPDGSINNLFQK